VDIWVSSPSPLTWFSRSNIIKAGCWQHYSSDDEAQAARLWS